MTNLLPIALAILFTISSSHALDRIPLTLDSEETYKDPHGKVYDRIDVEEAARILLENKSADVRARNLQFQEVLNLFGAMDPFNKRNGLRGVNLPKIIRTKRQLQTIENHRTTGAPTPARWDWREKGCVTPVKNKGQCWNGDWAFAATGAIESQILIGRRGQNPVILSEQQLLDCDHSLFDNGCNYGIPIFTWMYINDAGIANESSYPNTQRVGQCHFNPSMVVATVADFDITIAPTEDQIKTVVWQNGPQSIKIDDTNLPDYSGGVHSCNGTITQRRYGLLVGYDTDKTTGEDYWIVKMAWGTNWGEKGYLRLSRKNDCGLSQVLTYPIVNDTGSLKGDSLDFPRFMDYDYPNSPDRVELMPRDYSQAWRFSFSLNTNTITVASIIGFVALIILLVVYFCLKKPRPGTLQYLQKNCENSGKVVLLQKPTYDKHDSTYAPIV